MINSILPWTDFNEWLRYFWPASEAEVTAVQDFFVTKVRTLHEVCIVYFACFFKIFVIFCIANLL